MINLINVSECVLCIALRSKNPFKPGRNTGGVRFRGLHASTMNGLRAFAEPEAERFR